MGPNGDGYRPVHAAASDSDDVATALTAGDSQPLESDASDSHPSHCHAAWPLVCLAPLVCLLALIGVLALGSSLTSIHSHCDGQDWVCWQQTATSQWLPSPPPPPPPLSPPPTPPPPPPPPPPITWSPSSSPPSPNSVRLARLFDRLERGLPIVVGAVGGSNVQGHALNWTETVLPVLTAWFNEHFPVSTSDVDALQADHAAALERDCGSNRTGKGRGGVEMSEAQRGPPRHRFINTGVGGTTSSVASFCYRRLITQCDHPSGVYSDADAVSYHDPDLLVIDFSINDLMESDPFATSPPSANIERLIRQVLRHTSHTAVLMLHFSILLSEGLRGGEDVHHPVALHYHLPEISIRHFALEWLYEPMYQTNGLNHLPELKAQRLVPLHLPLPLVEAMRQLNGGVAANMDQLFWYNGHHLNEMGHRIMAALASQHLLRLLHSLRANRYTSLADPSHLPAGLTDVLPSLLDPSTVAAAALPPPLFTGLTLTDSHSFTCTVMYHPYNPLAGAMDQSMAEQFLGADRNRGWVYSRHGQTSKFAMVIPPPDADSLGQYLRLALPSTIHSFSVIFLRSWNSSMMGAATVWLSCGGGGRGEGGQVGQGGEVEGEALPTTVPPIVSGQMTPPVLLNGSWPQASTQLDLQQIWPLEQRELAQAEAGGLLGAGYEPPTCDLRFVHILHSQAGEFRFVGIISN